MHSFIHSFNKHLLSTRRWNGKEGKEEEEGVEGIPTKERRDSEACDTKAKSATREV